MEEHTIPELLIHFGKYILDQIDTSPHDQSKTFKIQLSFENLQAARERLLSFGSAVEVLEPLALRTSIVDYAKEIVNLYNE